MDERRRYLRLRAPSVPCVVRVAGVDVGLHTIEDLSDGGAFLRHPSPVLPAGTPIEVEVPGERGRGAVRFQATVARVAGRDDPSGSGYGVEFLEPPLDLVREIVPPAPRPDPAHLSALVVDPDGGHAHHLSTLLRDHDHASVHARAASRGMELFQEHRRTLKLAFVELLLPDRSGEDLIRDLAREKPGLEIHALTAVLRSVHSQKPLLRAGARSVLGKPTSREEVSALFTPR